MRVLVFGTFDHLHPGHLFLLSEASKRGDLYVVIARDATVTKIKGRLPDQSESERQTALQKEFPRAVVILGNPDGDFLAPVRQLQPDLILLGYDQKFPPGISESDLPCPTKRLPAFEPEKYKSSLRRQGGNGA